MKKISTVALTLMLMTTGCSAATNPGNTNTGTNNNSNTTGENKVNPELSNMAAVNLTASVLVNSNKGADTPTDEASEKVKSITSVLVSAFDEKSKLIEIFTLPSVNAATKGEIIRFGTDYVGLPKGKTTFKYVFNDKDNKEVFTAEATADLKEKTLYSVMGNIEQETINTNPDGVVKTEVTVDEMSENEYASGQMIVMLKKDDIGLSSDEVKKLFTDKAITVTEVKGISIPGTYLITFSAPETSSALILASEIDKFEYVEENAIATISIF